jgi:hypothetical protein
MRLLRRKRLGWRAFDHCNFQRASAEPASYSSTDHTSTHDNNIKTFFHNLLSLRESVFELFLLIGGCHTTMRDNGSFGTRARLAELPITGPDFTEALTYCPIILFLNETRLYCSTRTRLGDISKYNVYVSINCRNRSADFPAVSSIRIKSMTNNGKTVIIDRFR